MKSIIIGLLITTVFACNSRQTLFQQLPASHTGIYFNNAIIENDSINPLDLTNIYNGGGVGIGDFNNDGLQDLYFTGNLVENKMYLNNGDLQFTNITKAAGVTGEGRWCRGVTVVDINNDGRQDLYICTTILKDVSKRQNILYINQGVDAKGIPHFKDMAAAYGLNDTSYSTMAAFFDYDNDGDQDVYIAVNEMREDVNPSVFRPKVVDGSHFSTGRLYRNDGKTFTNVTAAAGVTIEGYSHAVSIADFNKDGWKDLYISNDFLPNDLLYINNGNGTFTDKAAQYFKHTSYYGMGQDVMDINNDGLADVVELDMNPEDNYRKKMMLAANSYVFNQNTEYYGYQFQYVRNTLQLNMGPRIYPGDSIGDPVFAEIGLYAGMAETDWSWSPLVQDYDNDGFRDILITNGYPKDVTDHDFIAFRRQSTSLAKKDFLLKQIPQVKIHNYAYRNNGNCTFTNATNDWGLNAPSFSNGAAYADLDNDGDLDYVVNNINDAAMVYKNSLRENNPAGAHYLQFHFTGDALNRNGLGVWVELYYQGKQQVVEHNPVRGYISSVQGDAHFGLGGVAVVDSVCIKWPDGKMQVLQDVKVDQVIQADQKQAGVAYTWGRPVANTLFTDLTQASGINYMQQEDDFIDFNIQKLLPHKLSEYGPALAAGDLNGDGLDDLVCGASAGHNTQLFLQSAKGKFIAQSLPVSAADNMGILLFDADNDKDLDLYIASGGYEQAAGSSDYADKLFINDGKAHFRCDSSALPVNYTSKSCVRAADIDKDGDLDLFVAGRVEPGNYPKPVSSFIYTNDGYGKFTNATPALLQNIGLVCDALFTDFDNDGWPDCILAGEWMPPTFLKNNKGTLVNITAQTGIANRTGWWNSTVPGDFDNDGDIDYIAGNLGLNSFYRATEQEPVSIYAKDFDNNGSYDAVPSLYLPASLDNPVRKECIAHMRDDVVKQIVGFKFKYPNYSKYASAGLGDMFTSAEMDKVLKLQVNTFAHCLIRNEGNGRFALAPLPMQAQFSCFNGMVVEDVDRDGNLDLIVNGNDYGAEPSVGRYDGCNGLVLRGDGRGGFKALSLLQTGIFLPGNGRALVQLRGASGKYLLAGSQNRGAVKVFGLKKHVDFFTPPPAAERTLIKYRNGTTRVQDINYGASFLSQSAKFILKDSLIASIEVIGPR